jgi:hypothetical protein
MNIDLFLTSTTEAGLVCDTAFQRPAMAVILDAQTLEMTLEFAEGETFHLNIPIEETRREKLLFSHKLYIGYFDKGQLADASEIPLLYLNDPYGSNFGQNSPLSRSTRSIVGFEQFLKRCAFAQALHRENLGDEDMAHSVLRGMDLQSLQYTPALLRERQLAAIPSNRPSVGPQTPGLGGGASGQARQTRITDQGDKDKS